MLLTTQFERQQMQLLVSTVHEYTGSHCREIVDMDVHMRVIANQGKSGSVRALFRHVKLFEV